MRQVKIGKQIADVSDDTLRFYRQIGVEVVGMPARYVAEPRRSRPLVPPAQEGPGGPQPEPWDIGELRRIGDRIQSFDLVPVAIGLPVSGNILLGRPGRDDDIRRVVACIRAAGKVGLQVLHYSFTALRASAGYYLMEGKGRGGAGLRAFDFERVRNLPPIPSIGEHTREAMWERLAYFLRAVVPAAEDAGVRLALHPNDPPVPAFRGVAQPVRSLGDLKKLIEIVDSPANSIFLDTGVLTEMGESAPEAIRYFGMRDRIGIVHFRSVQVEEAHYRYVETFHDEGDCDMVACMRAFYESGYTGMVEPDHTPGITGDTLDTHVGWALAIGQFIGLRNAVETRRKEG
ncbi:MAG: mannonate dehydratase [Chloroflexi bacterium]|nr:mannonate dehydratase [Chloroflexota bacterium]